MWNLGPSSPAVAKGQWDYAGEFFTEWFDYDTPEDGREEETFEKHLKKNRNAFHNCEVPIGIEVYDKTTLELYKDSGSVIWFDKKEESHVSKISRVIFSILYW